MVSKFKVFFFNKMTLGVILFWGQFLETILTLEAILAWEANLLGELPVYQVSFLNFLYIEKIFFYIVIF